MKDPVIIGDCMLYQGDCLEIMLMIGEVDHIITDAPFEKEAHTPMRRTQNSIRSGTMDSLDFDAISDVQRDSICYYCSSNCKGWFLVFCQIEAVGTWRDSIEKYTSKYKRALVWVKPDSSPQFNGQGPAQGYETIVSAWCGSGISSWNGGGRRGVFTHLTNQSDRHGVHKTEKPISLMRELIALFSNPTQTILDPFMGSGTTGIACVKLGRKFIGIELDPKYFDIACKRIEQAYAQPDMFIEADKPKPIQDKLEL